jgi:hypothetical protein
LAFFLSKIGHGGLIDIIAYCVMELYNNAEKANLKRRYFLMNGLDVSSPADYERGMRSFRKEALENRPPSAGELKDFGLRTCIALQVYNSGLRVSVRNNSVPTPQERAKIEERIRRSFAFSSLEEALDSIDTTEGAGLGLIIIALALKKLGLGNDAFLVRADNGETAMELVLPAPGDWQNQFKELSDASSTISRGFPIIRRTSGASKKCRDKNASLSSIGKLIAEDPAMSAATLIDGQLGGLRREIQDLGYRGSGHSGRDAGRELVLLACGAERVLGQKTSSTGTCGRGRTGTAHYARAKSEDEGGTPVCPGRRVRRRTVDRDRNHHLGAVHAEAERKIRHIATGGEFPFRARADAFRAQQFGDRGAGRGEMEVSAEPGGSDQYRHTGKSVVQHRDIARTVYSPTSSRNTRIPPPFPSPATMEPSSPGSASPTRLRSDP